MEKSFRTEKDSLGEKKLPEDALYGISALRAAENFPYQTRPSPEVLIQSYATVKQAALLMCEESGVWKDNPDKAKAILQAASEMSRGEHSEYIIVDMMQGGAGTSLNMNVNEIIANRALQILGKKPGDYSFVSPANDVNCFQSTNDTFPTAVKLAVIKSMKRCENAVVRLQESFEKKEREFASIVKIGRTELQEAVLTTLGREMGTYAEALGRDRWRLYKCEERLRVINLGGTAIGTGLGAPRDYIFGVTGKLRELTRIGFARAENLSDVTANVDVFAEVSGMLKACAVTLNKIGADLRLLSGPYAEIVLPAVQIGSSIMPGKYNPVVPESVSQVAFQVMSNDNSIALACASGNLELNAFLPLIAYSLLDSVHLLTTACVMLADNCVDGLTANRDNCRAHVENSTAVITALVHELGYDLCTQIIQQSCREKCSVRNVVIDNGFLTSERFEYLISPETVCQLGYRSERRE
ncbi:MAG: aspartate ammonia-lyase [Spirochaetes bacterium]|jgi:aspartate ammonia-lyase|nr:aspartate ammonia-lyase [Spirochaetota bacterium]